MQKTRYKRQDVLYLYFILLSIPFYAFSTMTMTSESASYSKENGGLLILRGNVVLKRGEITLKAPIVKVKGEIENPKEIICSDNVMVIDRERAATITAKIIDVFLKEKIAYCKGGVKIFYKNRTISGNAAKYEGKLKIATLNGSCTVTEEGRSFSSETIRYFIDDERIEFEGNVKGHLLLK